MNTSLPNSSSFSSSSFFSSSPFNFISSFTSSSTAFSFSSSHPSVPSSPTTFSEPFSSNHSNIQISNATESISSGSSNFSNTESTTDLVERLSSAFGYSFAAGSVTANLATLLAITMARRPLSANLRLTVSLCLSDTLTGTCAILAGFDFRPWNGDFDKCILAVKKRVRIASNQLTLLSLFCLAVDHYFAICRPLQHRTRMSAGFVNAVVIFFWVASLLLSFIDFVIPFQVYKHCAHERSVSFCRFVWCSVYNGEYIVLAFATFVLFAMFIFYALICRRIYRFQFPRHANPTLTRRNKRALCTSFLIVGAFVGCWLPYSFFVIYTTIYLATVELSLDNLGTLLVMRVVEPVLYTLIVLNTLIDPFIYAIRMLEVQHGYRRLAARMRCQSVNHLDPPRSTIGGATVRKSQPEASTTGSSSYQISGSVRATTSASLILRLNSGGGESASMATKMYR